MKSIKILGETGRKSIWTPALLALAFVCAMLSGCSVIWRMTYSPGNLPDWPAQDKSRPALTFKVGDRFVLVKPMFLEKNTVIKPPYCIVEPLHKSGSAEVVATLPAGTVIRLVSLKDGGLSGVQEYFVIEGLEGYEWVFVAGGSESKVKDGRNVYEFDREWLKKLD